MKMLRYDADQDRIRPEQISLILGKHVLISFQEAAGDVFDPVREGIWKDNGLFRK